MLFFLNLFPSIFFKGKNNSRTTSESTCTSDLPDQQEALKENSDEPNNSCTCPSSASDQSQSRNQDGDSNLTEAENQTVKERGDEETVKERGDEGTVKEEDDEGLTVTAEMLEETEEDEGIEEDEEEEEEDDDGWITPSNIKSLKQKMTHADQERVAVCVGCVTTDFAMQVHVLYFRSCLHLYLIFTFNSCVITSMIWLYLIVKGDHSKYMY